MKKTVIYMRQSLDTDKQPQSTGMQKDLALDYAKRKDWVIHEIYNEGKCSARKTSISERPQLKRLLADVEQQKIARVVVFKRDRLARNVQQYIEIYRLLKKYNVELHFTADNEPAPFNGPASEFIEAIMAGISEHEANNIVKRLIYSKIPLMNKGYWQAGSVPFAYVSMKSASKPNLDGEGEEEQSDIQDKKKLNGRLKVVPEKKAVVIALYEKLLHLPEAVISSNDFTLVCKYIKHDDRFKSLSNKQIWDIIIQPLHKGKMVQRLEGQEYIANNEITQELRIVDDTTWQKANDLIKSLKGSPSVTEESEEEEEKAVIPLLEGKLICSLCNELFQAKKKAYKCPSCKHSPRIKAVDEAVLNQLSKNLLEKGNKEWDKVIKFLNSKYLTPIKDLVSKKKSEILKLESDIKKHYQYHLQNRPNKSKLHLSHLINEYKRISKDLEELDSMHFHLKNFLSSLNKERLISSIKDSEFTSVQMQQLFALVREVRLHKGSVELNLHEEREGVNEETAKEVG